MQFKDYLTTQIFDFASTNHILVKYPSCSEDDSNNQQLAFLENRKTGRSVFIILEFPCLS